MKQLPNKRRRLSPDLAWDCLALCGLALVVWGAWMAWPPLGPIILGAALLAAGVLGAKVFVELRRRPPEERD
jgi:hypothetical protein